MSYLRISRLEINKFRDDCEFYANPKGILSRRYLFKRRRFEINQSRLLNCDKVLKDRYRKRVIRLQAIAYQKTKDLRETYENKAYLRQKLHSY